MPNEDELLSWLDRVAYSGIPYTVVTEPDIGGEHTAFAVAPSDIGHEIFASLPLHGREVVVT